MDRAKVIGNFLVAFGTTFLAASWAGSMKAAGIALISSLMAALISMGKEMVEEAPKAPPLAKRVMKMGVVL